MKKYEVKNFVCHTLPSDDVIIQNQTGIVKITNEKLISLIKYIEKNNITKISYGDMEEFLLPSNTEAAIEFLKKYGLVKSFNDTINFNVERIQLITNSPEIEKNLMYSFELLKSEEKIEMINNSNLEYEFNDQDLIVVFLNPYNKKLVNRIYDQVQQNGKCLLLMTYMYNSKFYIDNLYSPKWKSPCHHCHMGFIESQLRIAENGNLSYQGLIDILYHEDESFSVESQISTVNLFNFITLILNRLDNLVFRSNGHMLFHGESLEDINTTTMYDTENRRVSNDTSIHWEMCSCYE